MGFLSKLHSVKKSNLTIDSYTCVITREKFREEVFSMPEDNVAANWFVDVLRLGVANAYDSQDTDQLAWQADALCAQTDPEAFFPEKGGSTRDAKRICNQCEVKSECLEYALKNDERFGIWGGLSERERRKLKRRA